MCVPVGGHDHFDFSKDIKSVHLVKQLHQCSLDLSVGRSTLAEPSASDGVDLIHEDDTGLMVPGVVEHLPDEPGRFADVLVDNGRRHNFQEVGVQLTGHSSCQ